MSRQSRWKIQSRQSDQRLIDHLCALRQISAQELQPDFTRHLHDPMLLPDMAKAIELMTVAVKEKWPVAIFGDYDADGTPAAVILSSTLDRLGLKHTVILPTRTQGYGLQPSYVDSIAKAAKLLITVDTGITATGPIQELKNRGVQTIILDHHLPKDTLPPAEAIVDAYREDSNYPFQGLCGCALAFKFTQALSTKFPQITEGFCKWQLDLVAISTVADMMSLIGENRTLVHYGLEVLRKTPRLGLKAMMEQAAMSPDKLSSSSIAYVLGPRINALGRLSDNRPVFDLLKTTDPVQAQELSATIELANRKRQEMLEETLEQARRLLFKQNSENDKVYVLVGEDWPTGIIGLVAGRISEMYYRPVVVGSLSNGLVRASARSIPEYPIIEGLNEASSFIVQYGGHRQAAGCSVEKDQWPRFAEKLKKHAKKSLDGIELMPTLHIDGLLNEPELHFETVRDLESLEPYGLGNGKPLLALENAIIESTTPIGATGEHLRLGIAFGDARFGGVAFKMRDRLLDKRGPMHLAGYLQNNRWRDQDSLQFQVIDFKDGREAIK